MFAKIITTICLIVLITACSSDDVLSRYSLPIKVRVEASDKLNYSNNTANPVALRVYQLSNAERFKQANFMSLFNSDKQLLAEQLVELKRIYPIMPSSKQDLEVKLLPTTRFLAVVAEFTDYQNLVTTAVIELPEDVSPETDIWLGLQSTGVRLSVIKEESLLDKIINWD